MSRNGFSLTLESNLSSSFLYHLISSLHKVLTGTRYKSFDNIFAFQKLLVIKLLSSGDDFISQFQACSNFSGSWMKIKQKGFRHKAT